MGKTPLRSGIFPREGFLMLMVVQVVGSDANII
jgi:hypothetical protein